MRYYPNPSLPRLMEAAQNSFVLAENKGKLLLTGLLSMVPFFEGRYAVTIMLGMGMPAGLAYLFALVCSTLPMPFILIFLRPILDWFYTLPFKPVRNFAAWLEKRARKKRREMMRSKRVKGLKGKLSTEMLELIGLYVFVAVPLPGTGVWSGSLVATVFELPRRKAAVAILLGNMTACAIMAFLGIGLKAGLQAVS